MIRKISNILKDKEKTLSFEFFAPKTEKGSLKLFETVLLLKDLEPDFLSVTYGASGSARGPTTEIVNELQKRFGISAMHHLACVGHDLREVKGLIDDMKARNICNVLALYGDKPKAFNVKVKKDNFKYCYQLCKLLKSYNDYFSVGVAGFPEGHINSPDKETDLEYLKIKLDSGGQFVITQLFFDNRDYFDYVKRAKKKGINNKIIPGIMPIIDYRKLLSFCDDAGVGIPKKLHRIFKPLADDPEATHKASIQFTANQCRELLSRGAPGLHFFTFNRVDPTREIIKTLGWERQI